MDKPLGRKALREKNPLRAFARASSGKNPSFLIPKEPSHEKV